MEIKLVISYSDGKTEQKELKGEEADKFIGYKLGDTFDGSLVGLSDSLKITGGSDKDGFPMKKGVYGSRREKLLLAGGIGYNPKDEGIRRKKRVRGDTITEDIVQINTKVVLKEKEAPAKKKKKVEKPVEPELPKEEEAPIEAEAPKEEAKKEPKAKKAPAKKEKAPESKVSKEEAKVEAKKEPKAKKAPAKKKEPKKLEKSSEEASD